MDIKSNIDTLKASIDLNAKRFIAFQSKRVSSREIIKNNKEEKKRFVLIETNSQMKEKRKNVIHFLYPTVHGNAIPCKMCSLG